MPVSLIVCIVDGRKLFSDGRRGCYKIYRKVFEDAGISLDRWHQHRQELAEKWQEKVRKDEDAKRRKIEAYRAEGTAELVVSGGMELESVPRPASSSGEIRTADTSELN